IVDDIARLRQLAASITKPTRPRPTDSQAGQAGQAGRTDVVLASQETNYSGLEHRPAPARPAAQVRAPIKAFDGSGVFLFTPAPAYRVRYTPMVGRPDAPEYPAAGARIDYYLAAPSGEVKLDILDTAGTVVRSYSSTPPAVPGRPAGPRA